MEMHMSKYLFLLFLYFFAVICLQAQKSKLPENKIIVEISSVKINDQDTNMFSFQKNASNLIRLRKISSHAVKKLFQQLQKDEKSRWTTVSKLFTSESKAFVKINSTIMAPPAPS